MRANTRILLTTDAYLPWSGGSRVYYHNLYAGLAARGGYDVQVLTSHTPGDTAFDAQTASEQFRVCRAGTSLPDWKLKRAPALGRHLLRAELAQLRFRPDALHCGDLIPQAAWAWLLHRLTGRPYLVYAHGDEISQMQQRRYQPKLRDAIYRDAAAVVAANPFALGLLKQSLPDTRHCHLLTPGVDLARFHPGSETRPKGRGPVLLTAARLVRRKGVDTVLRSLPAVIERFPGLRYVVAGAGPELSNLAALTRLLRLEAHVTFAGDVPHGELPSLYRSADVFVMANREAAGDVEGFGMVFLEANACGLPVVAGRSGGAAAAVVEGETGLLADPEDPAAFSRALLLLLSNPHLIRRMGEAGLARVRREFRWASRVDTLHEITQSMLPRAARSSVRA